jgi:glycosyltransferase involved in cell wall biosynthesis
MKILLISNLYPSKRYPHYGSFVRNFEIGLSNLGVDFSEKIVITKSENKFLKLLKYLRFFQKTIYLSLTSNYDLIYVHYINHSLLPLLLIKSMIKKPIIANAHGSDLFYEKKTSKFLSYFTRKIIDTLSLLVVPSQYFKEKAIEELNISPGKIFISPSGGINFDKFKPLRSNAITNKNILTIGYLGRIDPQKGYDKVLEAIKILNDENVPLKFIIGGGGSEVNQLKKQVARYNLENMVDYIGFVSHGDVPQFMNDIDVLIFPSSRKGESLGLVPIEALACGTPVIAFFNGAVGDYIIHKYNGFIYRENSAVKIAHFIKVFKNLTLREIERLKKNAVLSAQKYNERAISIELFTKLSEFI